MKSLHEMNEQEANQQLALDYQALMEKYAAAGFQIQPIAHLRRYVVALLQGLEVPAEHLNAEIMFAVVKLPRVANPPPPPEALTPPSAANANGHQKLAEEA